ncbi:nucleotide-binding domain-containing protein [Gonapodya prolifera JEL478]|uniref:Nucleotide-binding domain-containing protein n=1 Tax=Gonapodya prolifera (strain JEL478) TaxID=1344416 RepID=A0A138ZX43_GONPJ|nr:nucleotide-binding domain-containing protein [Gonapodya prolifera JEL478]|eukprot:KXS09076.1 nucleotide-binding domain-containing protein [Gonapodya prolifera JEL478]
MTTKSITVLGAGVIGLNTAILLRAAGFEVTIVSRCTPEHPELDPLYTSPKAAAHWLTFADNDDVRLQRWDTVGFRMLYELGAIQGTGVAKQNAFVVGEKKKEGEEVPWWAEIVPDFRPMHPHELPRPLTHGYSFHGISIDLPVYLSFLLRTFRRMGGHVVVADVKHIDEVCDGRIGGREGKRPDVVVNCAGMGALTLGGVKDTKVFPTRGQTVIVRAPGYTQQWSRHDQVCYIVPRMDGTGTVCLGGTRQADEWALEPDMETAEDIVRRCLLLAPELRRDHWGGEPSPSSSSTSKTPSLDSVDVISHAVGLRPSRIGGPLVGAPSRHHTGTLLVHNYGHAGYGYQAGWGCAAEVVGVVVRELSGAVFGGVEEVEVQVQMRVGGSVRVKL